MAHEPLISIAPALVAQVEALGAALRARGWRLATAESCTGGLVAGACTAPAGASDWFTTGFVTYANEAKQSVLGVPATTLGNFGAVSAETAEAMARGALARGNAQLALGVTGVAGPGGGSPAKPVGTVWLGLAWSRGEPGAVGVRAERLQLSGDRDAIRAATVAAGLARLLAVARDGDARALGEAAAP